MSPSNALAGKRVVNTRSAGQAPEFDRLLLERGAIPLSYPCIDIVPPADPVPLAHAVASLAGGGFEWLVLTSANAVRAVAAAAASLQVPAETHVAAIGPGTGRAAAELLGLRVDVEPEARTSEALGEYLATKNARKVLLPLGDLARDRLAAALTAAGASVTAVTAYRTVVGSEGVDLPGLLRRAEVDAVIFTSPSTVDNLTLRLEREGGDWRLLDRVCVACIGPTTAHAAAAKGLRVQVQPGRQTLAGLIDALDVFFETKEGTAS